MENGTAARRIAIAYLRTEIRGGNDVHRMRELGARLGYDVAGVVTLDATVEFPLTTIVRELHDKPGAAVIVPNMQHLNEIDSVVRLIAPIITVEGERVLERAQHRLVDTSAVNA